jgi:hypothetical protein
VILLILFLMLLVIISGLLNTIRDKQALLRIRRVLLYTLSIFLFYYIIGLIVTW